uniref:metacaspase-1-like isoform X2 n=1 Tax=Erigeron canadensis TaxID=72917 RepID=UPI001CB939FB|nr:metacaspase-1-like isoform X2 [Erigeron canadensis]
MATTTQQCRTCGRTMVKMPGSQNEICPVCHTVGLFKQKLRDRVLFHVGQFVDAAANQYHKELQRQPSRIIGRRRAVLCGVTYNGHRKKLEASIHNVRSMQRLLVEEESDWSRIPTKRNIQMALRWLIQGCRYGDSLMFYYSGHGCQVPDKDGDESDGYDEALCPVDYRVAGMILDDEINATIVAPLPHGVTLHSVIDTCFSGTVLDLPFLCRINQDGLYRWEAEHQIKNKETRGGKAVGISACADYQNSADTSAFTGNAIGALTFSFIQAIEANRNLTYGSLLTSMRKKVRQAQQVVGRLMPFETSKSQEPQLSSSTRFEIYSEPFML